MFEYAYWKWEKAVPEDFCDYVLAGIDWDAAEEGRINLDNTESVINADTRRSTVTWHDPMTPIGSVATNYVLQANRSAGWNFMLTDIEPIQIAKYKETDKGHYDWHADTGQPKNGTQRKLSFVCMLSDPSTFEGGVLEIKNFETPTIFVNKGDIVVFPSLYLHRVTPVTAGIRFTAVGWMYGPNFK